ncbi:MAG TPA: methyltransferase, partial [Erythrobacter sp.]|nr:methyltransferase [Erythrobacter sp.]
MSQQISAEEQVLGIVTNHWQAHGVGLAAKLELADHLADGPLAVEELAKRSRTHAPSLYRMLRALESTGIFASTENGSFENTPASDCLRRNKPGSNWAWVRFTLCPGAPVYEGWRGLPLAVETGEPGFDQLHGKSNWENMEANPEAYSIFNLAMRDLAATIGPAVASAIDWSRYNVIADIGGGIEVPIA